jgi:hypothetical protein
MSGQRHRAADHERARELAALRLDGPLADVDGAWLDEHLAACADCRAVAIEYDDQRLALRGLRDHQPQAPRDLWARTAAAIEADAPGRRGWLARLWPATLPLAPVAGVVVVAIAVGAGLFNGVLPTGTPGGTPSVEPGATPDVAGPVATPIAMALGDIQVLGRGADGSLEILTGNVVGVCPIGAPECGLANTLDTTQIARVTAGADLDGVLSPDRGQLVVLDRGNGNQGIVVVPMTPVTPGPSATPLPPPTPEPTTSPAETPAVTPPIATDQPPGSAEPTPVPTPTSEPATPEPATPAPTVAVTPGSDGVVEIASDVIAVGSVAAYSPDGRRFAFTARPADGSRGPDVYVWNTGDRDARAVTDDHASLLAGWLGRQLLVSRLVDGTPRTFVLNPSTGVERSAHEDSMWLPTVGPGRRTAAWWDGTVRRTDDGLAWTPDTGSLVLASWPDGKVQQVLADGPLTDWDVRWDDEGTVVAVWVTDRGDRKPGRLSLYAVDPETGLADLDHPMLRDEPAFRGFDLDDDRLVWSAPREGGETGVEVAAWEGGTITGRATLPAGEGATVVR